MKRFWIALGMFCTFVTLYPVVFHFGELTAIEVWRKIGFGIAFAAFTFIETKAKESE